MSTQKKPKIKKRGRVWEVDCPHCFMPFGCIYIFDSFTGVVAFTSEHLGTHFNSHRPYIDWSRALGVPVARCRSCDWVNTTTPFSAAAQHLREEG